MASTSRITAHKLPKLLSLLPADGRGALVRPVSAPGVVYRITRTKLKFVPTTSAGGAGEAEAGEDGALGVSGRAWGLKFTQGRFAPHTTSSLPTTKPDGLIRGALKSRWVQVDESALDQATRSAIAAKTSEMGTSRS